MSRLLPALLLAVSLPAFAAATYDKVPSEEGVKANGLVMRVVKYEGSTNGAITIEVKNPTDGPQTFNARGIYFVPQVNPSQAPQRLGAVGPFRSHAGDERHETLSLAAGETTKLTLDVYCIDSHRSSPTDATPFRVAKGRMPRQLTQTIDTEARKEAEAFGGVYAPPAKAAVQSTVWKSRDAKWIKLDGEGAQEAMK